MKLASITNPQAMLDVLEQCQRQVETQTDEADALPAYLSEQIAPQIERFETAYLSLLSAREMFGQVRVKMRLAERELRELLRDGYHCIRRYARKQQNPELIHSAFGLHQNGRFPNQIKDLPSPTLLAQRMLEANQHHSPPGDNILRMPSPRELEQQKDKLIALLEDYHAANQIEREALEEMRSQKEQAETLILSIKAHIRVQTRNQDAVTRRQQMRSYGFKYKAERTEEPPAAPSVLNAAGDRLRLPKVTNVLTQDADPGHHDPYASHIKTQNPNPGHHDPYASHAGTQPTHPNHAKNEAESRRGDGTVLARPTTQYQSHIKTQNPDPGRHDQNQSHAGTQPTQPNHAKNEAESRRGDGTVLARPTTQNQSHIKTQNPNPGHHDQNQSHASPPNQSKTPTKQWQSHAGTQIPLHGLDSSSPTIASPPNQSKTPTKQWQSIAGTQMPLQGLDSSSPTIDPPPSHARRQNQAIPKRDSIKSVF